MALETWIDTLADVFNFTYSGTDKVWTYHLYSLPDFPENVHVYPCAITYPTSLTPQYGEGLGIDLWRGTTELHLFPSVDKMLMPNIVPFFAKIRTAMAANVTLGGKVAYFLPIESEAITGPVQLQYGSEAPHWGIVVKWQVKELTNVLPVGG